TTAVTIAYYYLIRLTHCLLVYCSAAPSLLHSSPTRRSSDLLGCPAAPRRIPRTPTRAMPRPRSCCTCIPSACVPSSRYPAAPARSEEHTSELQSRFDLVCRLLLEKKNIHHRIIDLSQRT